MEKRLLIIGHLNLDHIYTAETEMEERPGGGALYTAFAAGIYGDPIDLLSTRCPDFPESILERMHSACIDTQNVLPILGMQRRSSMAYDKALVRTNFAHKTEAWLHATIEQVPRHFPLHPHPYGCAYLAPMLGENQLLYAKWARAARIPVAIDLSEYYAQENTAAIKECLHYTDIFMPSEVELDEIYSDIAGDLNAQIQRVEDAGVRLLIVKQSTSGCLLCDFAARKKTRVGTRKLSHVVDATGAGDSFNGGFLSCYLATGDAVQSARYAAVVASHCIQDFSYFHLLDQDRESLRRMAENVPFDAVSP